MSDLEIKCFIDGHQIYYDQLKAIEYERSKHVLHEMKSLGGNVENHGQALSDFDIDALSMQEALKVNIQARSQYSASEMQELYKEPLKISDDMWKKDNYGFHFGKDKMQESHVDMEVHGIDPKLLTSATESSEDLEEQSAKFLYAMNPEHFCIQKTENGPVGMETFGMYGEPSAMIVNVDNNLKTQIEPDPTYPIKSSGFPVLANDGTPMHNIPYHQYKPLEDGIMIKQAVLLPPKAPKEITSGT